MPNNLTWLLIIAAIVLFLILAIMPVFFDKDLLWVFESAF